MPSLLPTPTISTLDNTAVIPNPISDPMELAQQPVDTNIEGNIQLSSDSSAPNQVETTHIPALPTVENPSSPDFPPVQAIGSLPELRRSTRDRKQPITFKIFIASW
ncbi:Hypothetical predicted protein [Olea europaea subsp. europaea]|uniref:Uncharacterized protein n=1 Tax=Olea europaea subsp. europaea TaxID=158383 RepID=A0A8S0R4I6_OLEEU|nr:Hypothetical predicted protein [Olea europaea subsp. europaea]